MWIARDLAIKMPGPSTPLRIPSFHLHTLRNQRVNRSEGYRDHSRLGLTLTWNQIPSRGMTTFSSSPPCKPPARGRTPSSDLATPLCSVTKRTYEPQVFGNNTQIGGTSLRVAVSRHLGSLMIWGPRCAPHSSAYLKVLPRTLRRCSHQKRPRAPCLNILNQKIYITMAPTMFGSSSAANSSPILHYHQVPSAASQPRRHGGHQHCQREDGRLRVQGGRRRDPAPHHSSTDPGPF